jgi:hypothetical protein
MGRETSDDWGCTWDACCGIGNAREGRKAHAGGRGLGLGLAGDGTRGKSSQLRGQALLRGSEVVVVVVRAADQVLLRGAADRQTGPWQPMARLDVGSER